MRNEQFFYVFDSKPAYHISRCIDFGVDEDIKSMYDMLINDYQKCVSNVLNSLSESPDHFGYNLNMYMQCLKQEKYHVNPNSIAPTLLPDLKKTEKNIRDLYDIRNYHSLDPESDSKKMIDNFCEYFAITINFLNNGYGEVYELNDVILDSYSKDCADKVPDGSEYAAKWYHDYNGNNPYKEIPYNMSYDDKLKHYENREKYQEEFNKRKAAAKNSFSKNLRLYEEYLKNNNLIKKDICLYKKRWAVMCKTGIYVGLSAKNKEVIKTLIRNLYGIQIKSGISIKQDEFIVY